MGRSVAGIALLVALSCFDAQGQKVWFPEPPFGGIARQAPLPGRSWTTPSPNCYTMLIGATSLRHRDAYVGYVTNALVSARALRRLGSVADFVVMVEYGRDDHNETSPPPLPEEALLASHGVRVAYLASAAPPTGPGSRPRRRASSTPTSSTAAPRSSSSTATSCRSRTWTTPSTPSTRPRRTPSAPG